MVVLALLAMLALPSVASVPSPAHPLHTTLTEVVEDRAHGTVRATIRVFADDFVKVASRGELAYVAGKFAFVDSGGRALPVASCGTRRTADLLWICVEARSVSGLAGLKVRSAVLCDLYDDQVNVVQAMVRGSRRSLLFVRGDGAKAL